jgi:phosphosugar-binding transcriptional regulator, rpiR family protein
MQNIYLLNIIKQNKNKFSSSEDSLVDYFLQLKNDELVNKTLADMANETDISQTTIYNFVKKLGFNGFQDFKIKLASNSIIPTQPERFVNYTEIDPSDSYIEVAKKTIHFNQQSLENLINFLDEKTLHRIVRLLEKSPDVYFFGQGGSSVIALDSYHKFLRTKLNCHYVSDYHIQLSICSKLSKKDCVFLFSHSGDSLETINLAKILQKNGCPVICITGNPTGKILKLATESVIAFSQEAKYRTESLTSRLLYQTVMDILYTIIMFKDEEENEKVLKRIRSAISLSKTSED